jgi:AcrR family transcriptional regulator
MPKVTEDHREERRQHILDAAINCFTRNGFHQTTMKDISKEADVSAGTVYIYFSSKDDIIEASMRRNQEARAARIEATKREGLTLQSLRELWDYYEKRMAKAHTDKAWKLWIQLSAEALRNPRIRESMRANWDDAENQNVELLRRAAEQGIINPDLDCDAIGKMFTALHDGLVLMKIIDPKKDVYKYLNAFRALLYNCGKTSSSSVKERRPDDE